MTPRLPKSILLPLAVGLVQILSGCMAATVNDPNKSAGGSDEIDTRIAVDRTGRPVAAARIALVRPNDSTGKPVAVSATGADGSFPNFVVPDGFYSVVLRDTGESMGKYLDSVAVKSQKLPSGRDTLLALGSVRGVVRVATGHSPTSVTIGLVGTDIRATVKADGTFQVELVPGGLYTLGAFTTMEGYGTLYKRIQLNGGQNLTLPDTLVMPFTGLPSPGALRVLQDTGTGNVRVSWNRVDHPDLLGYVLERVENGTVTTSRYLTDTAWTDSLGASWEAMPLLGPWPSREVAYRVRARSLGGSPDSKSAAQAITAKPPEWTKSVVVPEPKLVQDSATGDVHLAWPVVRHPKLRGYVVERIVGGKVVTSSILQNTQYLDSLGRHWDSLPLSGPWPDLQVGYRIGAIGKDTARGTVASLQGHAPAWVKSVDSTRIVVTQDTSTGNVRIGWKSVQHPHLVGYAVDRIENGAIRLGPTLVDTKFVDSLGSYWTALPLQGPWPKRHLSYRVRLISDTVGTDGLSDTVAFDAQPPTWTKHVDSVKVKVSSDLAANFRTFGWNSLSHPMFRDWIVERVVNGSIDCQATTTEPRWSDATCPALGVRKLDSSSQSGTQYFLWERYGYTVEYRISAGRKEGVRELLWGKSDSEPDLSAHVTWNDSGLFNSNGVSSYMTGGWLLNGDAKNGIRFTKDGINWETAPLSMQGENLGGFTGQGDSLWMVKLLRDSVTFEIHSRIGVGQWSVRTLTAPRSFVSLINVFVRDGKPLIIARSSQLYDWWWIADADSLVPTEFAAYDGPTLGYWEYGGFTVDSTSYEYASFDGLKGIVRNGLDITGQVRFQSGNASIQIVGGIDGFGLVASRTVRFTGNRVYFHLDAQGKSEVFRLNAPVAVQALRIEQDGFALYGTDGHLWKGKLNLPK